MMISTSNARSLALIALCVVKDVQAQMFAMGQSTLVRTRLDPIGNPGIVGGHVQVFAGTNAIDSNMNYASATGADCTTSRISVDKSGYWVPQLYYKWKNGTYSAISGSDGLATFWMNRGNEVLAVVPDDFRMVAGDKTRDFLDVKIPSHDAVQFQCSGGGYDSLLHYIPADKECETIRPQVMFPKCWNGKDPYTKDNSHVVYPLEDYQGGTCPPGFKRIPSLYIEAYYQPKTSLGADYEWYPGCFVLSNGDNFGLTYQANWLNGFPKGLLVDALVACPDMIADPAYCNVLKPFVQKQDQGNCQMKGQIVDEAVGISTPLARLPGNNPEFNSSRDSMNPRTPITGYVATAKLITLDVAKGGSCISGRCTDYVGQGEGSGATNPPAEPKPVDPPADSKPMPSSTTSAQATATQTGTLLAGENVNKPVADTPIPAASASGKDEGSKKNCPRRRKSQRSS